MMKKIRKWCAVWLSFAMALFLAAPALAASAESHSVLNVRFAPNGTGMNSTPGNPIVYTAYRIAEISVDEETGKFIYTLAPGFENAEIDINAILYGTQANANLEACKILLAVFGNYINENAEAIKATEGADVRTAETRNRIIGKENTSTDGVAQFKGLADGLYLISTNASVRIGNTRYTPYPLLVSIPDVYGDVTNRYITTATATAKFDTEIINDDTDDEEDSTTTRREPASDLPAEYPTRQNTTNTPTPTPTPTVTPPELNDIEMPDVPLAEPEVEILPQDVPLVDMLDDFDEPELEIMDMDVPLASLPQTGLLWWPVPLMAAAGVLLVTVGMIIRGRAVRDE